jgi:hypothetical protein
MWAGWYAGYLLGRLGLFTSASNLTRVLEETAKLDPWPEKAAEHLLDSLG